MRGEAIAFEDLESHLAGVVDALATMPMGETLAAAKTLVHRSIRGGFNSSLDPQTGTPWAPRVRYYPHPILMKSGAMMQAATGGGAGAIQRITERTLTVGVLTSVIHYAPKHQFGEGGMVARPFVGVDRDTLSAIGEVVADGGLQAFVGS